MAREAKPKYIIMCVGFTHSGKTTFAKNLVKELPDLVLIDNDEIASFINEKFSPAVFSEYNKTKRSYQEPNLKFLLATEILKFCLKANLNIIQASGNLGSDARIFIKKYAKKFNYQLITIYFNLPRETILDRINNTKKETKSFRSAKSWSEILPKQLSYAKLPPSRKNTIFYEINKKEDYASVLSMVLKLLKN